MGRETEKVPGRRQKDKGSPARPSVHAWKVLMNGSGRRGSSVCGRPQEARERAGEMTDRSRELQLRDSGASCHEFAGEGMAKTRGRDRAG